MEQQKARIKPAPYRVSGFQRLQITILLVLLALVSVSAASFAWFRLSDNTKVRNMSLELIPGNGLRIDIEPHSTFEEYLSTLPLARLMQQVNKFNQLDPVTSTNGTTFASEYGAAVSAADGKFVEFTLHFMANKDMYVHLTSDNGDNGEDGTLVTTDPPETARALRISFTAGDRTIIYQPVGTSNGTFTLATAGQMSYDNSNLMFAFAQNVDQAVVVRIWMEGTDAACTDDLRKATYTLRMRFAGTNESGALLE